MENTKDPQVEAQEKEALKMALGKLNFQSKEEFDESSGSFAPLVSGTYLLSAHNVEVQERNKYQSEEKELVIIVTFAFIKNLVGNRPMVDIEGKEWKEGERMYWDYLSTSSTGFTRSGQPSKTRACVSALLNKDPQGSLQLDDVDALEGHLIEASVEVVESNGKKRNKIVSYRNADDLA